MKLFATFLTILLAGQLAFADAVIFSGNDVKALKSNLDLNGGPKILSGTVDPSSSATTANKGSLYLNTSSNIVYKKTDNGSSTNWVQVTTNTETQTLTNKTLTAPVTDVVSATEQGSTPSSPASGTKKLYFKTDGLLYKLDNNGNEIRVDGASGGIGFNLLANYNSDAESGTGSWTNTGSGTFTTTTTAANVGFGLRSFSWNAAANNDVLASTAITVPAGLFGANCATQFYYQGFDTNITAQVYDGTNVLNSVALSAQAVYTKQSISFVCPSTGTIQVRFLASADAAIGYVDNVFLGSNSGVIDYSQSVYVGSAYIAETASCNWTRSNTAPGSFGTTAACPGPTVISNPGPGTIQTTDTDLPKFTVNNLPPGKYRVVISGGGIQNSVSGEFISVAINDGTTTSLGINSATATTVASPVFVEYTFEYTSTANRTFELYGAASSARTITLFNSTASQPTGGGVSFFIYRFPSVPEQAVRLDSTAQSWSGYHDNTCSWARTNTSYGDPTADASCALVERTNRNFGTVSTYTVTNPEPGIVFTPKAAGRYWVCASPKIQGGTLTSVIDVKLTDGTNTIAEGEEATLVAASQLWLPLCGIVNVSSNSSVTLSLQTKASAGSVTIVANSTNASSVEWSIFYLDQSFPMPLLSGSVASTNSGVTVQDHARLNCDASSAIVAQSGTMVSAIGNVSAGVCAVTISGFSAAPYCQLTVETESGSDPFVIGLTTAPTSSTVSVDCSDNAGTDCSAYDFELFCSGPK